MAKRPSKIKRKQLKHTLLVDGNALFKFGFFGAKDMYSKDGEHIGGLYVFITVLRKLLLETKYNSVYVFWDGTFSGKMRWEIYSDYKVDRNKDYENGTHPIDLQETTEKFLIRQYLEELCIRQMMDDTNSGVEADDFIAQYCLTKDENEIITICTTDRDLCQLIKRGIRLYLCDLREYITLDTYQNFFKHNQLNSKLIKIIGGDASDSIKGVTGVKETTLLRLFPELIEREVTLDEIINLAKKLQEERLSKKLKPLKTLTNIIEGNTNGVQGKNLYKINEKIINLNKPLIDENNKLLLEYIKKPIGDFENRGIKNVYTFMKRDGIDRVIEHFSTEYLLPFKQLIEREKNNK